MPKCNECGQPLDVTEFGNHRCYRRDELESTNTSQLLSDIKLAIHWDCFDDEINTLYETFDNKALDDILQSCDLGKSVSRVKHEKYDEEITFSGDLSLTTEESYFDLLRGKVRFGTVTASFIGQFGKSTSLEWSALRSELQRIRTIETPGTGRWSNFTTIPVHLSLIGFRSEDSSADSGIEIEYLAEHFVREIESHAGNNVQMQQFLDYYAPEIKSLKVNQQATDLSAWFATELLLTQTKLNFIRTKPSLDSISIAFSSKDFEWNIPERLAFLPEYNRAEMPTKIFWFTPVPANRYREKSDWGYLMDFALDTEKKFDQSKLSFDRFTFAVTMNAVRKFIEEYSQAESSYQIEIFYKKHTTELNELTDQMRLQDSWEGYLELVGKHAEIVERLSLPTNSEEIWKEYLEVIGRN